MTEPMERAVPSEFYRDDLITLHLGDCREILPALPEASVDAVVTDPPYEIGFLDRAWDASGVAFDPATWSACLRVLKPGGHLLAFGAPRTYHRLAVAVEDAGFTIRDQIHWVYGQGFPKGVDIAKALDKRRNDRAEVLAVARFLAAARDRAGLSNRQIDAAFGLHGMAYHWTTDRQTTAVPTIEQWERLRALLDFDDPDVDTLVAELNARKGTVGEAYLQREVVGRRNSGLTEGRSSVFLRGARDRAPDGTIPITAPATDAAKRWAGWHTALKPAHEPILVARKSTGYNSVSANVLAHGTGALNIDACRTGDPNSTEPGRWPTNLALGHTPACTERTCDPRCPVFELGDTAEFFPAFRYQPKAPTAERPHAPDGTGHATVKPLALMRWLVRLVTPPGGLILDPFAGTGTTLQAAIAEGMHALGIEQDRAHAELARTRLSDPIQLTLA
ncbi:MAG: DNA-methyltransferase [Sciscionella sp.]